MRIVIINGCVALYICTMQVLRNKLLKCELLQFCNLHHGPYSIMIHWITSKIQRTNSWIQLLVVTSKCVHEQWTSWIMIHLGSRLLHHYIANFKTNENWKWSKPWTLNLNLKNDWHALKGLRLASCNLPTWTLNPNIHIWSKSKLQREKVLALVPCKLYACFMMLHCCRRMNLHCCKELWWLKLHQRVTTDGMFKHVRSFGESKEKIVDIEGDSFQSPIVDVVKVMEEMKEQKTPP